MGNSPTGDLQSPALRRRAGYQYLVAPLAEKVCGDGSRTISRRDQGPLARSLEELQRVAETLIASQFAGL